MTPAQPFAARLRALRSGCVIACHLTLFTWVLLPAHAPARVASAEVAASAASDSTTPLPSIFESRDSRLQCELERLVGRFDLGAAVADGSLAIAVADITELTSPRVADLNGNLMMYAASLPKIAILLGAVQRAERDGVPIDASLETDLVQMIRYSSNVAATRALEWVGRDRLIEILESPDIALYDPSRNGGLWVGKPYGPAPAYRRDPLHGLSHGATALQVVRFYYLLEAGELANPDNTRRMKDILSDPGIAHKFVKGLAEWPDLHIYRKSGTWRGFHSDSALVESRDGRFVLVGLTADPLGGQWLERLAVPLYEIAAQRRREGAAAGDGDTTGAHGDAGPPSCTTGSESGDDGS